MPSHRRLSPDDPHAALARRLQAAWNRGDLDAVMAGHHPEAVYVMVGGLESLVGREFHGHDAIRGFLEDAGGAETFNRWGQLLFFREGLIVRAENYYDVDEALKAIGQQ